MAEAEPPGVRAEALAGLADQYIGAARLASALVHPGAPDTGPAPAGNLLVEEVVQGDPWGWFMAERSNLLRLVEQAHAARLLSRWDEASGAFRACICHGDVPDGDHGIVSGYRAGAGGRIEPVLLSPENDAAEARAYLSQAPEYEIAGAPETGLWDRNGD